MNVKLVLSETCLVGYLWLAVIDSPIDQSNSSLLNLTQWRAGGVSIKCFF